MFTTSTTSVTPAAPVTGPDLKTTTTDPGFSTASKAAAQPDASPAKAPPEPAKAESQLKLVVAKSDQSLAYSYTLVDQVTGRVVAQIPHETAEAAAASPDYSAGGVVDTRV